METLKMIVVIALKLLGMTSVFLATVYSPDTAMIYLSSVRATAVEALPFFANLVSDIVGDVSETLQYTGTVNLAIASALVLTLLIGLIALTGKKCKGHI